MALQALRALADEISAEKPAKNGPKNDATAARGTQARPDAEREIEALKDELRQAYKTYQDNIRAAGQLRTEIIKGCKAGEPDRELLLKAIECIGLMTGEGVIYKVCKQALQG